MQGTVVRGWAFSQSRNAFVLCEHLYPLRNSEQATKIFKKDYPQFVNCSLYTFTLDKEKDEGVWNAFVNSGCVTTY